jgi:hypothetical protein
MQYGVAQLEPYEQSCHELQDRVDHHEIWKCKFRDGKPRGGEYVSTDFNSFFAILGFAKYKGEPNAN